MKVIITGGHLSPAFSVIEKLDKQKILFIGRKYALEKDSALSLEYRLCQRLNIPFKSIKAAKFQRKSLKSTLFSFSNLPLGTIQALSVIKEFKPDTILSFGGYISLPVIFAAKILKIPVVIHEQTLEAGIANKICAKFAKRVCISWQSSERFFPKGKTILTGNPIRQKLLEKTNKEKFIFKNNLPIIYITGGSLGAHAVNVLAEENIEDLLKIANVIHQTGDIKKYSDFERLSKKASESFLVKKFFNEEELGEIYQKANLIISRSGINTITELLYFEKKALLIPLPVGQKNEQLKNAMFYKELGLAEVLIQKNLTNEKFLNTIKLILENASRYKVSKSIDYLIKKDAAGKIINILKDASK